MPHHRFQRFDISYFLLVELKIYSIKCPMWYSLFLITSLLPGYSYLKKKQDQSIIFFRVFDDLTYISYLWNLVQFVTFKVEYRSIWSPRDCKVYVNIVILLLGRITTFNEKLFLCEVIFWPWVTLGYNGLQPISSPFPYRQTLDFSKFKPSVNDEFKISSNVL